MKKCSESGSTATFIDEKYIWKLAVAGLRRNTD
jgi:hypothetical protein